MNLAYLATEFSGKVCREPYCCSVTVVSLDKYLLTAHVVFVPLASHIESTLQFFFLFVRHDCGINRNCSGLVPRSHARRASYIAARARSLRLVWEWDRDIVDKIYIPEDGP